MTHNDLHCLGISAMLAWHPCLSPTNPSRAIVCSLCWCTARRGGRLRGSCRPRWRGCGATYSGSRFASARPPISRRTLCGAVGMRPWPASRRIAVRFTGTSAGVGRPTCSGAVAGLGGEAPGVSGRSMDAGAPRSMWTEVVGGPRGSAVAGPWAGLSWVGGGVVTTRHRAAPLARPLAQERRRGDPRGARTWQRLALWRAAMCRCRP